MYALATESSYLLPGEFYTVRSAKKAARRVLLTNPEVRLVRMRNGEIMERWTSAEEIR